MAFDPSEESEPFDDAWPGKPEPFVPVPTVFWEKLSPEQFAAQQQIYRIAYEKARKRISGDSRNNDEFSFDI